MCAASRLLVCCLFSDCSLQTSCLLLCELVSFGALLGVFLFSVCLFGFVRGLFSVCV